MVTASVVRAGVAQQNVTEFTAAENDGPVRAPSAGKEIAFIDPEVADLRALLAGMRSGVEPILLSQSESAVAQIREALRDRLVDSIHIVAHGAPGEIRFAGGVLSLENLAFHAADLRHIAQSMTRDAELLLWTCNTAEGERGSAFIGALRGFLGRDVVGASGLVGAADLGGAWQLDANACPPLTPQGAASYPAVLATFTATVGVDTFLGASGNGTPNADTFNFADGTVNPNPSGDSIDGGTGNATDILNYTGTGSIDFSGITILNIENLTAAAGGNQTVAISAAQYQAFSSINLGDNVSAGVDTLRVLVDGSATISTSPTITGTEVVRLEGGANDDTVSINLTQLNKFTAIDLAGGTGDTITLTGAGAVWNTLSDANLAGVEVINAAAVTGTGATINLGNQLEAFTVTGSGQADTITGGSGNDTINAGGGNDTVNGGDGDDVLNGGLGNDTLTGGLGNDSISGGDGNDTIVGLQNDLLLDGGANTDTLQVSADFTDTGDGQITDIENVTITAAGATTLNLGNQTEGFTITGGAGNDTITAGSGNDTITGGLGNDSISAGAGNDIIVGLQNDTLLDGGADNDTLQVGASFNDTGDGQIANIENVLLTAATTLNLGDQTEGFNITGSSGGDTITGGSGNDTINGFVGSDSVNGGGGTDTILLTATSTDLNANGLNDAAITNVEVVSAAGAVANVTIELDTQSDGFTIIGGDGNDTILGSSGNDTINGGLGNDTLTGGVGNDTINGGDGNDTINGFVGTDTVNGDGGTDTIALSGTSTDLNSATDGQITGVEIVSASSAATINLSAQTEGFTINGSGQADTITGSTLGADTIQAGAGADTINGLQNDTLLDGGTNTDTLQVGASFNSTSDGQIINIENVLITTGGTTLDLSDQTEGFSITGSAGIDTIISGSGNDTINGFVGADIVDGGGGNDTILLTATSTDLNAAGDNAIINVEAVSAAGAALGVTIDLSLQTEGFAITGSANDDTITGGAGVDTINAGAGNDTITGGAGADTVNAGAGNDIINGVQNDALLDGGIDTDTLQVGASFTSTGDAQINAIENVVITTGGTTLDLSNQAEGFTITGSSGDDTIIGATGADSISAGAGNDIITGTDTDTLLDGGADTDTLQVGASFTSTGDAQIDGIENVTITTGGTTLDLSNQAEGFTITGSSGDDTISGSTAAADSISAGAGNDIINGLESDTLLDGGADTDTLQLGASFNSTGDGQIVNIENVLITTGGTTLDLSDQTEGFSITGSSGDDSIAGGAGNDTIDAGADTGSDTIVYSGTVGQYTVTHVTGSTFTISGPDGTDTLSNVETLDFTDEDRALVTVSMDDLGAGTDLTDVTVTLAGLTNIGVTGTVTFTDSLNNTVVVSLLVDGENTVDLTGLVEGQITVTVTAGALAGFGTSVTFDTSVPDITSAATASAEENTPITSVVYDTAATDNATLVFSLTGPDAALFDIDPATGEITFLASPDFENPADADANNVYEITVHASDGANEDTQTVSITVTNIDGITVTGAYPVGGPPPGPALAPTSEADTITGVAAADLINGIGGNDTLNGAGGADQLNGGDGNDTLIGGAGADALDGGAGNDTAVYTGTAAVVASLAAGTGKQGTPTDTFTDIENLTGGGGNDKLTGDGDANVLNGMAANDTLDGGGGNDTLIGGAGVDTVSYATDTAGVIVDLGAGTATGPDIGTDTIDGTTVENVIGGSGNDTLTGNGLKNRLDGGLGNDTINGGAGNDLLIGGALGSDTLSYAGTAGNVKVSLAIAAAQNTGGAGTDTASGFENLTGGDGNDTLTGSTAANIIDGGAGNDTINGGNGDDTLMGGLGNDTLIGGVGNDTLTGGDGTGDTASYAGSTAVNVNLELDTATGGHATGDTLDGIENLTGSSAGDTLTGDGGANILNGGNGIDTLNGAGGIDTLIGGAGGDTLNGDGDDTASYAGSASVTVNLGANTATGGHAAGDTLIGIANLTGGNGNDRLTGDGNANVLTGGVGNDTLAGGAGNDTLVGGAGRDALNGDAGEDTFVFATGGSRDTVTGYEDGLDTFDVSGVAGVDVFADLTIAQSGLDTVISWGVAGESIVVKNTNVGLLDETDFLL